VSAAGRSPGDPSDAHIRLPSILGALLSDVVGVSVAQLAIVPAAIAVVAVVGWRRARRRIDGHDRRAAKLVEYLAMWTRDRDWRAAAAVGELERPSAGAVAEVYRRALHDYSDEARRVRREHRGLHAAEGRLHAWLRGRRGATWQPFTLPGDCLRLLDGWRERADDDAGPPALESRLRAVDPERRAA
jgi:hypothetical protein